MPTIHKEFRLNHFAHACDRLLQTSCLICQRVGSGVLCADCQASIEKPKYDCRICGCLINGETQALCCKQCLLKPPAYERLDYIGNYEGVLSELIIKAKITGKVAAIVALQSLIGGFSRQYSTWGQTVADYHLLAMPTPRSRLMQRGFNLPLLLAQTLSKQFALPILPQNTVTLPFFVKKQAKLNRQQRQKNIHLYQINHKLSTKLPQKIVIVDDIVTTGTTIAQLSQKLRQEGVQNVAAWSVARVNNII